MYDFTTNPSNGVGDGEFKYSITSTLHGNFIAAAIDSNALTNPTLVRKKIYSDSGFTSLIWDYSSINGDRVPPTDFLGFIGGGSYGTLYVSDTYSTGSGGELDNISNTFKTPGPLPVLGAGAAFGFSRKLRHRIKASRTA